MKKHHNARERGINKSRKRRRNQYSITNMLHLGANCVGVVERCGVVVGYARSIR